MPCDGTVSQDWAYNSQADAGSASYRHIQNRYSQLVMDVRGASKAAGTQIVTWSRRFPAEGHQRFSITGGVANNAAAKSIAARAGADR